MKLIDFSKWLQYDRVKNLRGSEYFPNPLYMIYYIIMPVINDLSVSPSDQMGNKGAYICLRGSDLKPEFHQFTAVPHPNVKPMAYANSLMQMGMM
ncbi:hypothetical protein AAFF_G00310300 [Aldrovandia affinis]|uniref:Uncharacterized protein n=1 Tax=Aldrovandia affinis TaxID=143900 RepID=A0AAD7R808_9TELE|nr:hypothetical protein AAFF_G00310300 [Aldrovandia affinis]